MAKNERIIAQDLAEIKNKVSNAAKWAEDYDPGHTRQVKRRKSKYL